MGALLGALVLPVPAAGDPVHAPAPDRQRAPQTSDGVPGEIAPWVPRARRGKGTWTTLAAWQVAPGRHVREVRPRRRPRPGPGAPAPDRPRHAGAQPRLRRAAGGRLDLAAAPDRARRPGRSPGSTATSSTSATPAPRSGVGRDRQRKLLHGVESGWNCAFFITPRRRTRHRLPLHLGADRAATRPRRSRRSTRRRCGRAASGSTPTSGARSAATGSPTGRSRTSGWSWSGTAWSPTTARRFPAYLDVKGQVLIGRGRGRPGAAQPQAGHAGQGQVPAPAAAEGGHHRQRLPDPRRRSARPATTARCTRAPRSASTGRPATS